MTTSDLVPERERQEQELRIERQVAFASGLFQGDVTIRTFLESLAEGVVIIDNLGTILLVNARAEQMFGYPKEEIVGRPHAVLLPERFHIAHEEHVAHFFEEPRIRPMGLGLELAGRRRDGSEFPVEISLSFLETINGRLALAFISDITRRKEAEQALTARNQELDAFAHTVAHDMKGSLNVMMSYCQYLDASASDLPLQQIQDSVGKIWKSGVKLNQIIDSLLLLSSVSRESVPSKPVDMLSLAAEAIERLEILVDRRRAEIRLPDRFPTALGYAPWVEEILYNYISNAIKYGGTPPVVMLGGEVRNDGFVEFWVEDNGPGLAPEEQARIFDYGRPRKAATEEGYGLGLSIVKRIAEKLNGQVAVRSGAAGGSIFTFSLPLAQESTERPIED
jgi:PAS domain S-box-containing protein